MTVLPDPGHSRAVLIGASTYRHLADLPAVRNNLSGFRDALVAPALGGLPADNCTIVAEPARPVDIYRTLRQHATVAEDTLLVYFAGHGRTGSRNELWLCLPDTDPDELPYSAWPYDELRRAVADSRATKKVVILDCCFSGRALADQAGDEETILGQVGIEGSYLLTATAANAVALAPPGERYTAFTGALLGLLNKGIPDGPELLTFGQIYPRLQHALTSRQLPRPRQQGSDTIAHLALTRNLAYTGRGGTRVFEGSADTIAALLGDARRPADSLVDVALLLDTLREAGAHQQAADLADRAAAQAPLNDPGGVARLLDSLMRAGAYQQAGALVDRAVRDAALDDPGGVALLLDFVGREAGQQEFTALADRAAAHAALDDPGGVVRLLDSLQQDDQQFTALADRAAAHAPLDDPGGVALLLGSLQELGADEQAAALADRAVRDADLDDPRGVAPLLDSLWQAGAHQRAADLADRAAAHAALDDPGGVARLMESMRRVGADEQAAELADRAAAHAPLAKLVPRDKPKRHE
jgi:hypothetical protein